MGCMLETPLVAIQNSNGDYEIVNVEGIMLRLYELVSYAREFDEKLFIQLRGLLRNMVIELDKKEMNNENINCM